MIRRWCRLILSIIVLLASSLGIYAAGGWWLRTELTRANREISAGRFESARDRLARLSIFWWTDDEVHYQLGVCEQATGHWDRALRAWARVTPGSRFAVMSAQSRDRMLRPLQERGRFAELEQLLDADRRGAGPSAAESGQALARLLRFQGRFGEAKRLLREEWARSADPSRTLRDHWMLDAEPVPIEMIRGVLDQAAVQSPDDDRVWLGRANWAIWSGRFEAADQWLSACLKRRPLDPAVWRARLDWARAAGRVDAAAEALSHLPADQIDPVEIHELRAWFANLQGDQEAERQALEQLIEDDPGNASALERLATLASEAGRADRADEIRKRKAQVDQTRELYRKNLAIDITAVNLPVAARLAESLGRWFEARGWWSLVLRRAPDNTEARAALNRVEPRAERKSSGRMSAELIKAPDRLAKTPPRFAGSVGVAPAFVDDATTAGLRFAYESGRTKFRQLPETMGGGIGVLDYDGDGLLDVYCVQGGRFPPSLEQGTNGDRLFHNKGDGTFDDVTQRAGLSSLTGYGHGVSVGDYDNDGRPDLFLTRWRSYALLHNEGNGTFQEVTGAAGLGGDRDWPTSAAWADLDNDGDLDLYVCHYLVWDAVDPYLCRDPSSPDGYSYCDPRKFNSLPDHLFRNDGGRFVDVTSEAGIIDRDGRGLGVIAADLDGDGRIDLYVANDTTANFLFRNLGDLRFEDVGIASGTAAGASGGFQASMGVACGDLNGDGLPDLAVTNFYGESTTLYRNLGGGVFGDQTASSGMAAASRALLGFGIAWLDFNNDGRLDLTTANGHVNEYRSTLPFAMPAQLMAGIGGGRRTEVGHLRCAPWKTLRVGRGLAPGDLDNDGRPDLLIVSLDSPLAFFHNKTAGGRFMTFRLEGTASNRDGVGAKVTIVSNGRRQVAQRVGGGSYLSASDPRLAFGLGTAERVESVEVAWPSGRIDRYRELPVDAGYLLREGSPEPMPLKEFARVHIEATQKP